MSDPFFLKNCTLAAIATGISASSLTELNEKISIVDEGCIYNHFWGSRMNPQFVHPQHHNDFAVWAYDSLHDNILAERMSIIDPTDYPNLEGLRIAVQEAIETRLDEYDYVVWTKKEDKFHFINSTIIVFGTQISAKNPTELAILIEKLPPSSVFYHFIDARGRTEQKWDDFSVWLTSWGSDYKGLVESIQKIDPYFLSLRQIREQLSKTFKTFFEDEK